MTDISLSLSASGDRRKLFLILIFDAAVVFTFIFGDPKGWLNSVIAAVEMLGADSAK